MTRCAKPNAAAPGTREILWIGAAVVLVTSLATAAPQNGTADPAARQPARSTRPPIPLGLDLLVPVPRDNPWLPAVVRLGRDLFFDTGLSLDGATACASCHAPELGFTDGQVLSVGAFGAVGSRNAPTLVNRAYGRFFFLDGRAASLEEQALHPIGQAGELGLGVAAAVARLSREGDYAGRFRAAFGRPVNAGDVGRAVASYVRTILSGNAPFDRYASGDLDALDGQQRRGLELFRGRANCDVCHVGPNFSDEGFHNTGVAWRPGDMASAITTAVAVAAIATSGSFADDGRFAVSGRQRDRGAFKTPTLREVVRTAPYMHDGSFVTLEEVVDFYDRGGNPNPGLDRQVQPLNLTDAEKGALVGFLRSLSGRVQEGLDGAGVAR